jgi:phosphoserine phosphatase
MGCKVAVVSGGFTIFTDKIKERLGLDYSFANELVIKNGKLTGEVKEPIIDAEGKQKALGDLMRLEKISKHEVIAIGDGANDRYMLMSAGIGIAFNAKDLLKKVADGVLTKDQLKSITYCMGEYSDY